MELLSLQIQFRILAVLCWKIITTSGEPQQYNADYTCSANQEDCVCIMSWAIREMRHALLWKSGEELENRLKTWECDKFIRLPKVLSLDGSKDGLILPNSPERARERLNRVSKFHFRRVRRFVDSNLVTPNRLYFGAPTDEAFEEAMASVDPNGFHQYAIFGTTAKFKCAGPGTEFAELENRIERVSWTHFNGNPIPSKAVNKEETGELEIPTVRLSDVDIYNCTIFYNSESTDKVEALTFTHQLSVVTEPIFMLEISIEYETTACNQQESKLIEEAVPLWTEEYIAKAVRVHHSSVTCTAKSRIEGEKMEGNGGKIYTMETQISGLGLEVGMYSVSSEHIKTCTTISCKEHIQARLVETIRDSLLKIFRLSVEVKDRTGEKVIHTVVENSLSMELILKCVPGFALRYKLCFPCKPGFYSASGSIEGEGCVPCPLGTYQSQPASSSCLACPHDLMTKDHGSTSVIDCHNPTVMDTVASVAAAKIQSVHVEDISPILVGSIGGTFLIILIIIILCIYCCCPNSAYGKCIGTVCCFCCKPRSVHTEEEVELMNEKERKKERRRKK